jgi:hypothetical protein
MIEVVGKMLVQSKLTESDERRRHFTTRGFSDPRVTWDKFDKIAVQRIDCMTGLTALERTHLGGDAFVILHAASMRMTPVG